MVHIHREIILNLSEDIVLSVLTFLHLHTQGCTLCYLISRLQRFLTIEIESCFYTSGKHYCLFKLQLMICHGRQVLRRLEAPGTFHSKYKKQNNQSKSEVPYPRPPSQRGDRPCAL